MTRFTDLLFHGCVFVGVFAASVTLGLGEQQELIVSSPHWEGIKEETLRAFSAWHQAHYGSPVVIRWRGNGGGSQLIKFIRGEYMSHDSSGIDVLYGGGVDAYIELKKDGLLQPCDLPPPVLAALPAQINGMEIIDPEHAWFGASLAGFGIITNERARETLGLPEVHRWIDLCDPRLMGWISSCDPRASSSVLQIYEIILQTYGWEKGWAVLMQMSGNVRNYLPSAAASAVEVGIGDAVYGVSIDFYGQAQSAYYGPENVRFELPVGETVITPDSIGILKNPPHLALAQHFLEFVLSRDGQLLWMLPKGAPGGATKNIINRMSVLPTLYNELKGTTPVLSNPFAMSNSLVYSQKLGTQRRSILAVLIATEMIDNHDDLVRAWKALHSSAASKLSPERQQELMTEFLKQPCMQVELLQTAQTSWNDPLARTALVNQWQSESSTRYRHLVDEIGLR